MNYNHHMSYEQHLKNEQELTKELSIVKPIGMLHLKGVNDKGYTKYKDELNSKPKETNNLWLQLS